MTTLTLFLLLGAPRPEIPDGLEGFAGELIGEVVRKYENSFTLRVSDIGRTWEHSRGENPESAIGRTLLINLNWEETDDGNWRVAPSLAAWLELVERGDEVCVDVANREGQRLHLLELNEEQRRMVERGGREEEPEREGLPEPEIPDGLHGFSGELAGIVTRVGDLGFVLRVVRVTRVWEGNEAENPESAVGRELLINAQWEEGDSGEWHPVEMHVRWISTLEVGEDYRIEVINDEGERLHILELNEDQRERARGDGD